MRTGKLKGTFIALIALIALAAPAAAQAEFGIKALKTTALERDGSVDLRAGSHPYSYTVGITMNQDAEARPEGTLRDLIVDLPAGLVGNPQALPLCSGADFEGATPNCPLNTQIGVARTKVAGILTPALVPVYNLTPPAGVPASIGFSLVGLNSFQEASLRSEDHGISISDFTIPTEVKIQSITETIWGVPPDPAHDSERGLLCLEDREEVDICPSEVLPKPFLTLPTSCSGPLRTTVRVDSVEEPGVFKSTSTESLGEDGVPKGLNSCERPPFEPKIVAQPETTSPDAPTGLHVNLHIPQSEAPDQVASAHLKDAVVTLPRGMVVNPSAADGLAACAPAQIDLKGPGPAQCPPASKVGSVRVQTPLLDHPVPGDVYLAKQGDNPFGSLLALYIVLDDPISGVIVKLPGKVEPDPVSGQLKASFPNNPQLPFEDFNVDFSGGPRATLTTPFTCGKYTAAAALTPWTAPEGETVSKASSFSVTSSPAGACAPTEAQMPNAPSFEAGTATPLAGTYSPFVMKLSRENGSQRFSGLNVTLPPGVAAKFAGVSECSEAQIAQAKARSNPGEGAIEAAQPSCPQASALGTVTVGAGSGAPLYVQGHAYLAGPYKGAPFSVAIITPAIAGPFDLGTVVVRAALYVDETTAQGTIKSDPFPTILQGIPLDVRSVSVRVDRKNFTLNPTSCEVNAVKGELISTTGQAAPLSNRFQVGGCNGLAFAPKLALKLSGSTQRGKNPALRAVLTQAKGQANIHKVSVVLPKSEFIDNRHISTPCTRVQFNAGPGNGAQCPSQSILGYATAYTPLLDQPLHGPVYFRSNGGERQLPDLVASLGGQVHLNVVGFIDSVRKKGSETSRVRNRFVNVPDAPCGTPYSPSFCKKLAKSLKFKFEKSSASESSDAVASPSRTASKDLVSYDRSAASASGASLKGSTKRGGHPALRAVLKMKKGEANIHKISVALPHSEFLAQSHIRTICTNVQFNAGSGNGTQCPKASIYGYAKAITPLLDNPLQGPVYLRSSTHPLPDLVAALNGQINVDLVGRIDSKNGGIRSTFENVPDAPVSEFILSMEGGQKGLLENSTDICVGTHKATVNATAQNGKTFEARPELRPECGKKKSGKKKSKGGKKS